MLSKQIIQTGKVTVTTGGTAETVTLGWKPDYVKAYSINNAAIYEWFKGMDAGTSMDTVNSSTTQIALNAAGSITVSANGFSLGADIADTTADVIYWLALRG